MESLKELLDISLNSFVVRCLMPVIVQIVQTLVENDVVSFKDSKRKPNRTFKGVFEGTPNVFMWNP